MAVRAGVGDGVGVAAGATVGVGGRSRVAVGVEVLPGIKADVDVAGFVGAGVDEAAGAKDWTATVTGELGVAVIRITTGVADATTGVGVGCWQAIASVADRTNSRVPTKRIISLPRENWRLIRVI